MGELYMLSCAHSNLVKITGADLPLRVRLVKMVNSYLGG